jgi:hypothetical protein
MSEKFRIDLGYDPLFASASFTTRSDASVVVYDKATQAFYYTGSYLTVSGSTETSVAVVSAAGNTYFPVTLNVNAATSKLYQDPIDFKYNPSTNILIVNGTISSSNFINVGTVAATKITGSFTGSFTGDGSGLSGVNAGFPFTGSAAISGTLSINGESGHITASGNISSSGGTITGLNYQNTGTVAGSKITGSFTGSFTGSLKGTSSHAVTSSYASSASYALSASHEIIKEVSSSHADTASYVEAGNINQPFTTITASSNISSSGGTITGLNYINTGTVAGSKITGSFTGSFTGSLTGTSSHATNADDASSASFATVAAGLVHTPNISVGTLTNASTVAGSKITGSFTGSYSGSFFGSITNVAVTADNSINAIFPLVFANSEVPAALYKYPIHSHLGFNPQKNIIYLSGSIQSTGSINLSGSLVNKEDTIANTQLTGSFTGSFTGSLKGTSSWANNATDAISASFATVAAGLVHTPDISVGTLTNTSTVAGSKITGSFTGSFTGDGSGLSGVNAGFPFTGSAAISGTLIVEGPSGKIAARTASFGTTASPSNTTNPSGTPLFVAGNISASGHINANTYQHRETEFVSSSGTTFIFGAGTGIDLKAGAAGVASMLSLTANTYAPFTSSTLLNSCSVSETHLTGSFTGSLVGALTGTSSFATVAAGLVHTPNISVGTLTNTSTVAASDITGSFTGSFTGDGSGLSGVTATPFPFTGSAAISGTLSVEGQAGHITSSGNISASGTGSFGNLDINGAVQLDGTFTVGANDQGYDVTLFGDTANKKILWDASSDHLKLFDDTKLVFGTGANDADFDASIYWNQTDLVIDSESDLQLLSDVNVTGNITSSGNISASGGTITALNYQNTGTVANTKLTGSFTGSFTGDGSNLTGVTTANQNLEQVLSEGNLSSGSGIILSSSGYLIKNVNDSIVKLARFGGRSMMYK